MAVSTVLLHYSCITDTAYVDLCSKLSWVMGLFALRSSV